MKVDPEYAAFGDLFKSEPMFRIPKYQRSYAWDVHEISDFISDLEKCFENRVNGSPINHFFGGVVSVEKKVTGVVQRHEYELVDGQQRFATFILLVATLLPIYQEILDEVIQNSDITNQAIIEKRIQKLNERFIEFQQEVNRQTRTVEVLEMSKADEQFFKDLIRENNPTPTRESHNKLKYAFESLKSCVQSLTADTDLNIRLDNLEHLQLIVDADFSIIHIVTYDHKEAYKLFQVLNDRGKSLTEGDLLRAKTLELLEGFQSNQNSLESNWDEILMYTQKETDNYLRWIYSSRIGVRAGSYTLFDDYLSKIYLNPITPIDQNKSSEILNITKALKDEVILARKISKGEWPFTSRQPITSWDRNRLSLLVRELGLTVTIPILLSSFKLGEKKFAEIIWILERFLFRYKILCNQHIEAVVNIFHTESVIIRNDPSNYDISVLNNKLKSLQDTRANDAIFINSIDNMKYKVGGGNKPLKYFIMTLEHFKRWCDQNTADVPKCLDKTRVYDFSSTTIEHVYPRNAVGTTIDQGLEPIKNNIGNLTFLGPQDNRTGGNDNFSLKKPIFDQSSVGLNQLIGTYNQWSTNEVDLWNNTLKDMACKVFKLI